MNKIHREIQPYKIYFEVQSKLGILVSTTKIYWNIITQIKHPTLKGKESEVKQVLTNPDEIRVSKKDKSVLLFIRKLRNAILCSGKIL